MSFPTHRSKTGHRAFDYTETKALRFVESFAPEVHKKNFRLPLSKSEEFKSRFMKNTGFKLKHQNVMDSLAYIQYLNVFKVTVTLQLFYQ